MRGQMSIFEDGSHCNSIKRILESSECLFMVSEYNEGPGRVVQKGTDYELVQEGEDYITLVKALEMSLLLQTNTTSASTVPFAKRFVSFCTLFFCINVLFGTLIECPLCRTLTGEYTSGDTIFLKIRNALPALLSTGKEQELEKIWGNVIQKSTKYSVGTKTTMRQKKPN
jgi:hypothetical protein